MKLHFQMDGQPTELDVEEGHQVLDLLRNHCHRKDILSGCSPQGVCGSCMIVVRGKPRLACTLRAKNINGKDVQSAISIDPQLKETLVEAFIACGASQCGYCMNGILTQVSTLLSHVPDPTEAQIDKALQMHSCRCTGWTPIKRAVMAVAGKGDLPGGRLHQAQSLALLGKRPRVADISHPKMRIAIPVLPSMAHGQFLSVAAPTTAEGVDFLHAGNYLSPIFIKPGEEFHRCDALIGLVIADTEWQAKQFRDSITDHCRQTEAKHRHVHTAVVQRGEVEANAEHIEFSFAEEARDPGYLEPEAVVVIPGKKGLEIYVNGADPFSVQERSPDATVHSWAAGGGFGGRIQLLPTDWAIAASSHLNCPIQLLLSMEESIRLRPKSPPTKITIRLGYLPTGHFCYLKSQVEIDGGTAAKEWIPLLEHICTRLAGPYDIPNMDIRAELHSRRPTIHRPLRDQATMAGTFALERTIDELARRLHIDAITLRQLNISNPTWAKILDSMVEPYCQALDSSRDSGLACAVLHRGWDRVSAAAVVHIEAADSIVIHGGHPDTGQFHEWRCISRLATITGIAEDCIHYQCSTMEPGSASSTGDGSRELGVEAVEHAAQALRKALQGSSISQICGQRFTGTADREASEHEVGFSVSVAELTEAGKTRQVTVAVSAGKDNQANLESLVCGAVHAGLGHEKVEWQDSGLPSPFFRSLGIAKAKNTPKIIVNLHPSEKQPPTEMAMTSTAAAIGNARSRFHQTAVNTLPLPPLERN